MTMHGNDWIHTPGLRYVVDHLVPAAAKRLSSDKDYDPVLIIGPTGCGKSFIRDLILTETKIPQRDITVINCAAIARSLLEAELFGYIKGALTGTDRDYPGILGDPSHAQGRGRKSSSIKEPSRKRIVVMDEIGTLPRHVQAKLLTFIDDGYYRPVGSIQTRRSNVGILGITNSEPEKVFRGDFLYRFFPIKIPGLHARRHDIPILLKHFAPKVRWTKADLWRLVAYHWPGNIRELRRFARSAEEHVDEINTMRMPSVLRYFSEGQEKPYAAGVSMSGVPPRLNGQEIERYLDHMDRAKTRKPSQSSDREPVSRIINPAHFTSRQLHRLSRVFALSDHIRLERVDLTEMDESIWEDEIRNWCDLFSQDPYYHDDLMECIVNKRETEDRSRIQLRYVRFGPNRSDDQPALENAETRYAVSEEIHATWFKSEMTDLSERSDARSLSEEWEDALRAVLDKLSPDAYRTRWLEHIASERPSDVADRYGMSKNTVRTMLARHRENVEK